MALLGMFEDDEYCPDFSMLVVRDTWAGTRSEGTALLDEHATDAQPCGTIARAGNGWLEGSIGDGDHLVRLEYHDHAPDDDRGDWDDVLETPYRSATGSLGLTTVTSGPAEPDLALGGPGTYRVRVARRPGADGDAWRLQFWSEPEPPEPPRWLVRRDPVVYRPTPGWDELLGFEARDLTWIIWQLADGGAVTMEQVDDWGIRHSRGVGWLDGPALPDPSQHPYWARQRADVDQIAAQLGVPAPQTRRQMIDLLIAAGVIVRDGAGRYLVPPDPPRAQDVLDLPPDRVASLNHVQAQRFNRLASDIISTAAWAGNPAVCTVDGLADRLLAPPGDVRAALDFATMERLVDVEGDLDAQIAITVRPKRPRKARA